MKTIKFSHRYTKHPINVIDGSEVRLIEVLNSKFEDLSDTFKEYDTKLYCGGNHTPPKKGDCLVLLFLGAGVMWDTAELFTTVRRSTPVKELYYKGLRGQTLIAKIVFDGVMANKPPDDCTNMVLYGDGKKFLRPVWYSCGRCKPCPRDHEDQQ